MGKKNIGKQKSSIREFGGGLWWGKKHGIHHSETNGKIGEGGGKSRKVFTGGNLKSF